MGIAAAFGPRYQPRAFKQEANRLEFVITLLVEVPA
jgi:hypothetical protein